MSERRTVLALAIVAVTLAGCAVGPNYRAPALPLDAAFVNANAAANASDVDIATFWRGFGDAELSSLVERALAANGDVRIARARLQESRANLQARAPSCCPRSALAPTAVARSSPSTCCPATRAASAPTTSSTAPSPPTGSSTSSAATVARASRRRRR